MFPYILRAHGLTDLAQRQRFFFEAQAQTHVQPTFADAARTGMVLHVWIHLALYFNCLDWANGAAGPDKKNCYC